MKRILSLLLAAVMIFGMLPISAFAAESDLGTVHVIVKNSNAPTNDSRYWTDEATPWNGIRAEVDVSLKQDSSVATCVDDAIRSLGEGHYVVGADRGFIEEIDGLKSGVGYSGWMVTLNDWFTNEGVGEFKVSNGRLEAGDVICADYTLTGSDLGGSWENNTKTLENIEICGAALVGRFSSAKKNYELTLDEGQRSGNITIVPTASNKNFQVRIYKGEHYDAAQKGFKRNAVIPVEVNDTLWVVVGDPAWPTMNEAGTVEAGVYQFHVVEKAEKPTDDFESFFRALDGVAEARNDADYPFTVDATKGALQSTNQKAGNSKPAITLTFDKSARLDFQYQCSTEKSSWNDSIYDKFLVKLDGTQVLLDGGIHDDFKSFSLNVPAGSTVTLSYEKDRSGDKGEDCIWVKNFTVETLANVTFPNMPQDAKIIVKRGGEIIEANADGKTWALPSGSYTYSASCFGFVSVTDIPFQVEKTDLEVQGTLERLASAKVNFALSPKDAQLTVTQGEETLKAEDDGSYQLPISETPYQYEVTAVGYSSQTGEITVSNDTAQTIEVALARGNGWDGTTKEPSKIGEVYQIGTAAELAWFAQQVNGGDTSIQGVLTANVKLSDIDALNANWMPIGNAKTPFAGKFDGQGYAVENLYIHDASTEAQEQGLFGVIAKNGSVRNLILQEPDVDTESTVGAVAGKCSGVLSCCATKGGLLKSGGGHVVGGVVGYSDGTVEMCFNTANVENPGIASGDYTAGIVGENRGQILDCYNLGTIKGHKVAGIAGWGNSFATDETIENCYNGGKLDAGIWNVYHISGYSKRTNCYHIDTNSSNNYDSNSSAVTDNMVKNLATLLGGAFENREDGSLHLLWENPDSSYTITIEAVPEDAQVTLTKAGQAQTAVSQKGVHTFANLPTGIYNYTVSYEKGDCEPQTGEIVLNGRSVNLNVELEARKYDVIFKLEPKDGKLTLKQGEKTVEGGQVDADAGTVTYCLPNGTYTYSVEKFGYTPVSGQIIVNKAAVDENINMAKAAGANVTFDITPSEGKHFYEGDPKITVTIGDHFETPVNKEKLYLPAGEYSYTIQAATFTTIEGTVTVESKDQTVVQTMQYSKVWDGKTAVAPKLVDDVYQITNGYELAGFRDLVNEQTDNGQSCNAKAVLLDNIDLGDQPWMPIGHDQSTGFSGPDYGYTGEFDGNGKTISGLNVQMEGQKRAGLFGTLTSKTWGDGKGTGSIHDLTVEGSVKAGQYMGGIAALVLGKDVVIRNCTSHVTVAADDGYAGGVAGYLKDGAKVEYCTNMGTITGKRSSGGIVGNASNALMVENCCNKGTITASGGQNGGVVGSSSKTPIANCVNHGNVTSSGNQIGGVVGFTNSTVEYCYNTGAISGRSNDTSGVGGIVGKLNYTGSSLKNSYNSGKITDAEGGSGTIGAVIGNKSENGIVVENCYFLDSSCAQGMGGEKHDETDQLTACTADQLKSLRMAAMLGGSFAAPQKIGYPILGFESSDARYITFFHVTPEDAVVEVESATAVEPGVYVLTTGNHKYTVSKAGYGTVTGTVDGQNKSQVIPVTLSAETFHVTFTVTPQDAVITVKNEEGQVQAAGDKGYTLQKGTYTYTVEKFGYETESGSFTVENSDLVLDPITLKEATKYAVNLEIVYGGAVPADTTVQIFLGENQVGESALLNLPNGKYTYKIIASGYFNAEGEFTVEDKDVTVTVNMDVRTTWDGSKSEPKKVAEVYQITCAEELAWFAENVNSGGISNHSNAVLLADIVVNDEKSTNKWIPVGDYEHQYAGTFEGNGKSVKGLDNALFGYGGEEGLIKNVTVYGTVTGSSNRGGICTASGGSFENCTNYVQVSATGQRIGGIVGVLYSSGSIKNCVNYGTITTAFQSPQVGGYYAHIGGVVGYAYGTVEGCVNHGTVAATQKTDGGIGGVVGETLSTVTNCYNMGTVTGCTGTGGVAGIADQPKNKLENCYNAGSVRATDEYPNPNVGAVVGDIGNADGETVGQIINCYYLENSYYHDFHGTIHNGGVGYGTDSAVKKTEDEMKVDTFALSMGQAYNADSDIPINNGFPVLKWQGGKTPATSEDQEAVAADKLALDVTPTTVTEAMTLKLTKIGAQGSTITWKSSNSAVISDAGVVTLPAEGSEKVVLTATITKGTASDTRDFVIVVQSKKLVDQTVLDALVKTMGDVRLKPVFGTDINITAVMQAYVKAVAVEKMPTMDASKLSVTLTAAGSNANQADKESHIAKDGTISYFYQDPATAIMNGSVVKDIEFKIAYDDAETNCTAMANIPWNADKVREAMGAIANELTFDLIKGENTDENAVTKELILPVKMDGYGWSLISWESSQTAVVVQPGTGIFAPSTGVIYPEQEDVAVTLTATITFNRTVEGEPAITVQKEIPVTIPGSTSQIDSTIEMALAKYTMEKLTDSLTGEVIDPNAVDGDISLLSPRKLGIDGRDYSVVVIAENDAIVVNGYRAKVYRPLPDAETAEVPLTVTITHKKTGKAQSKMLGTVTILPLTQTEIDGEVALMERVKENFFEGIRQDNVDRTHVTSDLRNFQEVYEKDGKLVWVYSYKDRTDTGIVPSSIPKDGYDESYNLFHSSEPTIIQHENLLLKRIPATNTQVTITACLDSQEYGRYAERYPENEQLQKLSGQMVSVTVTVLGNGEDQKKANEVETLIEAIGDVTLQSESAIRAAREAYKALTQEQKDLVSAEHLNTLQLAEKTLAILKQPKPEVEKIYRTTGDYLETILANSPVAGSEWVVLALARSGREIPAAYYENVTAYIEENINDQGQLGKVTDNACIILALTAMGKDVTNVAGHNLLQGLSDMNYVKSQGVYGMLWALIALDSHAYEVPDAEDVEQLTREKLLACILDAQLEDNGWANGGDTADVDMTAMVIQALAPYYKTNSDVKAAVDKAVAMLSETQNAVGGFGSIDGASSESCAQIIIALTALDIDPAKDARFVKNDRSVVDALCSYALDGEFSHVLGGDTTRRATEQGYRGLTAYFRYIESATSLFDMSDVKIDKPIDPVDPPKPTEPTEPSVPTEPDHTHTYTWFITQMPTETLPGEMEGTCSCGNTLKKMIPVLGVCGDMTVVPSDKNVYDGKLKNNDILFEIPLTDEEAQAFISGADLNVILEITDITKTISDADKKAIEQASNQDMAGLYLNVAIFKQIGNGDKVAVNAIGEKIQVSIVVPDNLRSKDRTYQMIRMYEGKPEILACTYDDQTGTLVFESNLFSVCALSYKDIKGTTPNTPNSPATGDESDAMFYTITLTISGMAFVLLTCCSKKRKRANK